MIKNLMLLWFILHAANVYGQEEQPFKSGFRFSSKLINDSGDSLFLVKDTSARVILVIGYLEKSGERILRGEDSSFHNYKFMKIYNTGRPIIGTIKERKDDSLFIEFWYFRKDPVKGSTDFVNSVHEDSLFVFKITKWKKSSKRNQFKDIPYQNNQFTIVNFPFRVNLGDGTVETGFTNATISISRIFGKARIYKSKFLEPRYRYVGVGLMFGAGAREDINAKNEMSVIYGLSVIGSIYGVKLVVASGFETGFKTTSKKTAPFLGVGFGLDIFSVLNPEIKKKE